MADEAEVTFGDDTDRHRYEIRIGGSIAGFVVYRPIADGVVVLVHTETMDAFTGQGVAARVVTYALDDLRARNLKVRPDCPYVRSYLGKHPEYADLVG